jgi:hypothetical protein
MNEMMLVQVNEINDVRNHDETKGEIAKKKNITHQTLITRRVPL